MFPTQEASDFLRPVNHLDDDNYSSEEELKEIISSTDASLDERMQAVAKLQKLPRDSSPVRRRNRCRITGRPHGYYRKFGLNRIELRDLGNKGLIPGLTKSSW